MQQNTTPTASANFRQARLDIGTNTQSGYSIAEPDTTQICGFCYFCSKWTAINRFRTPCDAAIRTPCDAAIRTPCDAAIRCTNGSPKTGQDVNTATSKLFTTSSTGIHAPSLKHDGHIYKASEKAQLLNNMFAANSQLDVDGKTLPKLRAKTNATLSSLKFRPKVVLKKLRTHDMSKANGSDGISATVLKK
ncbi:hypothetical protein LSAT2_031240 [Lamellibrachia satsuma]|nr:hypothetical protein LSAT2_031240 [Lamellibrachia satsuma]